MAEYVFKLFYKYKGNYSYNFYYNSLLLDKKLKFNYYLDNFINFDQSNLNSKLPPNVFYPFYNYETL